jgi:hypothetical protein
MPWRRIKTVEEDEPLGDIDDCKEWLRHVTYKPGTTFIIDLDVLQFEQPVVDAYGGDYVKYAYGHLKLNPPMTKRQFYNAVHEIIAFREMHEMDEWFKIDGIQVYPPNHIGQL